MGAPKIDRSDSDDKEVTNGGGVGGNGSGTGGGQLLKPFTMSASSTPGSVCADDLPEWAGLNLGKNFRYVSTCPATS